MLYACLNGEYLKPDAATVSVNQSGMYYGAGCFETILYKSGEIQYWKRHYNRLCEGLLYLGINKIKLPRPETLYNNISTLLQHNNMERKTIKIRIQCSICNEQGYSQNKEPEYFTFITVSELPARDKTFSLKVASTRTVPSDCRPPHLKLSNMLHFREAFRQAKRAGFHDALMLSTKQYVSESSVANIFWIKNNTVFTPSEECDILPGIIRNEMINYLRAELGMDVAEGEFRLGSVLQSEAVWLTNSLMLAKPVDQIGQVFFDVNHPVLNSILEYFTI